VRTARVSPIRPPGTLAAVTVELRAVRKKLDRIVEHMNATGTLAGRHDELREALTECKATMQSYTAALSRIIER